MSPLSHEVPMSFPLIIAAYIEGKQSSVRHRQQQFHRLHEALVAANSAIIEALQDDNGFLKKEAVLEYSLALQELRSAYESINLEVENAATRAVEHGQDSLHRKVGLGIIYIRPDRTKSDIYATLSPICAALAAGNCIIVEISTTTRRTTSILRGILVDSLDHDTFAISDTVPPRKFLEQCTVVQQGDNGNGLLDGLITTKKIISSPSSSLNAFYVDRTANLDIASRSIIEARFAFSGKSSFAPTIVFVHEAVKRMLSARLVQDAQAYVGLATAKSEADIGVVTDKRHNKTTNRLSRVENLVCGPKGKIVFVEDLQSYKTLAKSEDPSSLTSLILCTTRSMEDMIDSTTDLAENVFDTPSSAFIFAGLPEAKYLAVAVAANFTCVNTFPVDLLVGPRFPRPSSMLTGTKFLSRYSREIFEERPPIVLTPSIASQILTNGITLEETDLKSKFLDWAESMQAPLRPTGQRLGKKRDFFETGIQIGAGMVGVPCLVLMALLGKALIEKTEWRQYFHLY